MKDNNTPIEDAVKDQVTALYELMKNEKLEELEIKQNNFYVYLKRKTATTAPAASAAVQPKLTVTATPEAKPEQTPVAGQTVKSPLTGMFYRSPSPTLPPFVKEGDVVEKGKTLCIIEAMKVMNEIKAESRVRIVKILVENGKPVNASQDLFEVENA